MINIVKSTSLLDTSKKPVDFQQVKHNNLYKSVHLLYGYNKQSRHVVVPFAYPYLIIHLETSSPKIYELFIMYSYILV